MATSVVTQNNSDSKMQPYLLFMMHDIFDELMEHLEDSSIEKLRDAFHPTNPDERIKSALSVAEEDKTGFAELVLARNYAEQDKKLEHYKKAVELSKAATECEAAMMIFALASLELAELLWEGSRRADAITVLKETTLTNGSCGQFLIDATRFSLVTYLICEKQIEQAREVLNEEAVPTLEWHYANALLKFIEMGSCDHSRGAAAAAFAFDDDLLEHLSNTEFSTMFRTTDDDGEDVSGDIDLEEFFMDRYVRITGEAWRSTEGALKWIDDWRSTGLARVGEEGDIDTVRLKRIQDEIEMLTTHIDRANLKEAKKSFAKILRDANRLNDGGVMLEEVIASIAQLDAPFESQAVESELLKRLEWLASQEKSAKPNALANSYDDLATLFCDIEGHIETSVNCAKKSLTFLAKDRDQASTHVERNAINIVVLAAVSQRNWPEVEACARRLIEIVEQTSAPNHLDMINPLQLLRMSLKMQGRDDEELEVAERVYAIDEFADQEVDECDEDCGHEH